MRYFGPVAFFWVYGHHQDGFGGNSVLSIGVIECPQQPAGLELLECMVEIPRSHGGAAHRVGVLGQGDMPSFCCLSKCLNQPADVRPIAGNGSCDVDDGGLW
jgi:hypothetical protein